MLQIREALISLNPILEEEKKYGTPFYTHKGQNVCYLSTKKGRDYVQVGFVKGFKLSDPYHRLVEDNRTIVRSLNFVSFTSEDNQILLETVYEALELN